MDFIRSKLLAYIVAMLAIAVAISVTFTQGEDNTQKFVTLCQVQERFLNDVISVRQATVDNPDTSAGEKDVARQAVKDYTATLDLLHTEFPAGCE